MLDTGLHVPLITITCLITYKNCDSNSLVRHMKQTCIPIVDF